MVISRIVSTLPVHAIYSKSLANLETNDLLEKQNWRAIVITSLVILLAVSFIVDSPSVEAKTHAINNPVYYSCGTLSSDHCYGINRWLGTTYGASTRATVVQLHAGNGFMNNTLWVGNNDSSRWIEAGYAVIYNKSYEFWYWAYINDSGTYLEYDAPTGLVSGPGGDFGNPVNIYIWRVNSTTWNAAIYGWASSWLPNGFTLSNFTATSIDIGQELAGTSGSSASTANFYYNRWRQGNGNYVYQTVNGTSFSYYPPYAGWIVKPSGSSTGGEWYVYT
jgi:hypothetical protein